MESSRHVGAVTEVNLSALNHTLVDRINAVPGLKTSTGKYFTFSSSEFLLQSWLFALAFQPHTCHETVTRRKKGCGVNQQQPTVTSREPTLKACSLTHLGQLS
jgi:hypothetical protein